MLTDELDLIYSTRPTWNILRKSDVGCAGGGICEEHCEYVGSFTDNTYNVRIALM
jgi:hypothetical protein